MEEKNKILYRKFIIFIFISVACTCIYVVYETNRLQIASWMHGITREQNRRKQVVWDTLTNWSEDIIQDYVSEPGRYKQDTCIVVQPLHSKIQQLKTGHCSSP